MSEELDGLIEMARTIRMTPEQAERQRRSFAYGNVKIENDSIPWEMIHRAAEDWKRVSGRSSFCFLSGRAGWRCLNLFSGFYGTTEVVPFPRIGLYGRLAAHPFSHRTRKKGGAPRLEMNARSLDFARDDRFVVGRQTWGCVASSTRLHLNWCKNGFLRKSCQAPLGVQFPASCCA